MPSLNPKLQMLYLGLVSKAPKFIFQGLESAFKLLQLCWCSWPHSPKRNRVPKASDQPQMHFTMPLNTFEPVSTNLELHAVPKPENCRSFT